jgi:SEC-C motif/Aspartyl protease
MTGPPPGAVVVPGHTAFTVRHTGRSPVLVSDVEIFPAFTPQQPAPQGKRYKALYDTGATHSSVSPKVVADLQLASIGATNVGVGGGTLTTSSHLVNIGLPNKVMFPMMRVAQVALHGGIDALIGMDIIGSGDFSVTHHQGKTTFSYCVPSRKEIDFVAEINDGNKVVPVHSDKVGRNSLCPCGSKKKYKKCHGS